MLKGAVGVETRPTRRPAILRWLVMVFVFSMVFDSIALNIVGTSGTVSKMTGIAMFLVFLISAPSFHPKFRWYGRDLRWFICFFAVVVAEGFYRVATMPDGHLELTASLSYIQLFIMFLIFRDLTRDTRIYKGVLAVFVLTYVPAAIMTLLNVPLVTAMGAQRRIGLAGSNVNQLGFFYALITVFVVTWLMTRIRVLSIRGIAAVTAAGFLVIAIGRTGSRGAALALATGLLATTLLNFRAKRIPKYVLLMPILMGGAVFFLVSQQVFVTRMTQTLTAGDTGGREEIARSAVGLLHSNPLIGYGASYSVHLGEELGFRGPIAAHNTYLQILLSFGLIGFIPFVLGLLGVLRTAWGLRESVWGSVWLAVLIMTLMFGTVGHVAADKYFWILLALAANAGVMVRVLPAWATARHGAREIRGWAWR